MERVLVLGCAGSGKSTLARRLASELSLPLIDLDREYWRPGWVATPKQDWLARVAELAARPRWVMDGNYGGSLDIRLPRADTVIWLDFPRLVCLRRALWRTITSYGRVRETGPDGCPERFNMEFMRYIWGFPEQHRPQLVARLEEFGAHARQFTLKTDQDGERLLAKLRTEHATS